MALYTKGSTLFEPTSQYGVLNILWNSFYLWTWLYILKALWFKALVFWVQIHRGLLLKVTEIFLLKVIFSPKSYTSSDFLIFISFNICFLIFHFRCISFWFEKLYPGVLSHLKYFLTILGNSWINIQYLRALDHKWIKSEGYGISVQMYM